MSQFEFFFNLICCFSQLQLSLFDISPDLSFVRPKKITHQKNNHLRHIELKVWSSIKVSCRLGKNIDICFWFGFFSFNLKLLKTKKVFFCYHKKETCSKEEKIGSITACISNGAKLLFPFEFCYNFYLVNFLLLSKFEFCQYLMLWKF